MKADLKVRDQYQDSRGMSFTVSDNNISVKRVSDIIVVSAACVDSYYPKEDTLHQPKTSPREIHRNLEIHLSADDVQKIVNQALLAGIIGVCAKRPGDQKV